MIELPETYVLASQIEETLAGKTIKKTVANAHPHSFAWYTNDPQAYGAMLDGQRIISANPGTGYTCGGNTEKDLFNNSGGYETILSKNTLRAPCPVCGGVLVRQAFLGGNIYFCGVCQPLDKN